MARFPRFSSLAAFIALAGLVAPGLAFAQDAPPAAQPPAQTAPRLSAKEAVAAVKQADLDRIAAMVKVDIAALETVFDDKMVYTHSSGKVDTKASLLEALRTGATKYMSVEFVEPEYQAFGNTVVCTGVAKVSVKNATGDVNFSARFTEVWTRKRGVWKLVVWQTTRLPEEKK